MMLEVDGKVSWLGSYSVSLVETDECRSWGQARIHHRVNCCRCTHDGLRELHGGLFFWVGIFGFWLLLRVLLFLRLYKAVLHGGIDENGQCNSKARRRSLNIASMSEELTRLCRVNSTGCFFFCFFFRIVLAMLQLLVDYIHVTEH